jgi:hypothetical protein
MIWLINQRLCKEDLIKVNNNDDDKVVPIDLKIDHEMVQINNNDNEVNQDKDHNSHKDEIVQDNFV